MFNYLAICLDSATVGVMCSVWLGKGSSLLSMPNLKYPSLPGPGSVHDFHDVHDMKSNELTKRSGLWSRLRNSLILRLVTCSSELRNIQYLYMFHLHSSYYFNHAFLHILMGKENDIIKMIFLVKIMISIQVWVWFNLNCWKFKFKFGQIIFILIPIWVRTDDTYFNSYSSPNILYSDGILSLNFGQEVPKWTMRCMNMLEHENK